MDGRKEAKERGGSGRIIKERVKGKEQRKKRKRRVKESGK
jgi:hypothetical protein